jgi:hypothetical protein
VTIDMTAMRPSDHARVLGCAQPAPHSSIAYGTALLLCGTATPPTAAGGGRGLNARMNVGLTLVKDALTVGLLNSPSVVEHLLPVSGAARRSREIITRTLLAWNLPHLVAPATVLGNELVSHTIARTSTMMTLVMLPHRDLLYLWVRSGNRWKPAAQESLDLRIIHTLAQSWGSLLDGDDTLLWAALPAQPPP